MSNKESEEILQLTQEALNLANTACHFDKQIETILLNGTGNSSTNAAASAAAAAYAYYDKAILNLDEVMSKLPNSCPQWMKLSMIRMLYDERMDHLREQEANRTSFFKTSESSKATPASPGTRYQRRKIEMEDINFTEMDIVANYEYENPPLLPTEIPFWFLRNTKKTIESGGYISDSFFVPKRVWKQSDVKFSGLAAKTAAFEIIIKLISNQIETLYLSDDIDSLIVAEQAFLSVGEELLSLQNQLSKPFPYIKEIVIVNLDDASAAAANTAQSSDPSLADASRGSTTAPSSSKSLSSFVTALGKNVRKYAEVGFHRLAVALPSKLSVEELSDYTSLICKLCEKTQILAKWHQFASVSKASKKDLNLDVQVRLDSVIQMLATISGAIRDTVCEILLRDIEQLIDRYLLRTRKSLSQMFWDQDQGGNDLS